MDNKERFIRWQGVLRDQLTFLNSLLLAISFGILGYVFSLLKDSDFYILCGQRTFFTSGLILIFLSAVFGLSTAICRLLDFRATTKKIRSETKGLDDLESLKESMKLYGKVTWFLFYSQLVTEVLGVISIVISLCLIYQDKLF
jgi:uncharacterized membrane protein